MHDKKSLALMFLALFSIVILLAHGNIEKAFAVITFEKVTPTQEDIMASFADFNTDTLWNLVYDSANHDAFVYGCDLSDNDACVRYNVTIPTETTNVRPQDIWCGRTNCFITYGADAVASRFPDGGHLVKIASVAVTSEGISKGQIISPILNRTSGGLYHIDGKDSLTGGFGGINLWVWACNVAHSGNEANCRETMILFDGITMGASHVFPEYFSGNGGWIATDIEWNNGLSNNGRIAVAVGRLDDLTNTAMMIYNTGLLTKICDTTSGNLLGQFGSGRISWLNTTHFYISSSSAASTHAQLLSVSDCDNEIAGKDITSLHTLLSTTTGIRDVIFLDGQGLIGFQEAGANARVSFVNVTDDLIYTAPNEVFDTFPTTSQNSRVGEFTLRTTISSTGEETVLNNKLWIPYSGADQEVLFMELDGDVISDETVCVEVQFNGQQVCYVDTDGNGIPNFPNGGFDVIRPAQNITTVGADVVCSTGFSDIPCENDNPRENGVGLLLLIIIVLMSYAVVVSIHVGAMKFAGKNNVAIMDYLHINPVLLLIMLIIDVGAAWQLKFIPDIIFYTIIVVMGGLAAWGYFSAIRGRGSSA